MPTIIRLSQSKICMYLADHNPPHFHILANDGKQCLVHIGTMGILRGSVGASVMSEALAWAKANSAALATRWTELNP